MSDLFTEAKDIPTGTGFPARFNLLIKMIAKYIRVGGLGSIDGVNYGNITPSTEDNDKPWFRFDGDAKAIGWFWHNGVDWVPVNPIGSIYAFHGDVSLLPAGHSLCDGGGTY